MEKNDEVDRKNNKQISIYMKLKTSRNDLH